jgi:hypothetical protein
MTQDEYETIVSDQTQVNAFSGEVSVADGTWIYMKDSQNNIIFADAVGDENSGYKKQIGTPKATVSSLDKVRAIYDGSKVDEFTMIGTFTLPENVQIVECGFLFTTDTTLADPTVEDVGNTSGLYRFKSTRYTVGNQFVIGIKNVDKTVEFEYRAYATVLDEDGNMKTYYGATYQGNNIF